MSSHNGQNLSNNEDAQLIELSKGLVFNEEKFIKEYCKKHPTFDDNIKDLLTKLVYDEKLFTLATRIILNHESIDDEDKFNVVQIIMNSQNGFKFKIDLDTILILVWNANDTKF